VHFLPGFNLPKLCEIYYSKEFHGAPIPGDVAGMAYEGERVPGDITLILYVAEDGRVRNVLIAESSGTPRLDGVTAACLLDRSVRFKPESERGVPVGSWMRLKWHWRVN
jgi:TonB family protein